jgi:hypothetical protein
MSDLDCPCVECRDDVKQTKHGVVRLMICEQCGALVQVVLPGALYRELDALSGRGLFAKEGA